MSISEKATVLVPQAAAIYRNETYCSVPITDGAIFTLVLQIQFYFRSCPTGFSCNYISFLKWHFVRNVTYIPFNQNGSSTLKKLNYN